MKQQIRAVLTKVKSLQHSVLCFPRCFEEIKNRIGELLDDLTESEAGEFYDLLDHGKHPYPGQHQCYI